MHTPAPSSSRLPPFCPSVAATPDRSTGLDAIHVYEGAWNVTLQHFDTPYSKASTERTTLRNECWRTGSYFACNQFVDGQSKVLLVFTYDAGKNEYTSYQIPSDGAAAGAGKLYIQGNRWTYPWQTGQGTHVTWFRVVNTFEGPDKINYRQEYSKDQVHWTQMGQGGEIRIPAK